VRVNADTPADAHRGRDFGAEGIGLCRTEHMFFEGDRLSAMREMILAQDSDGRKRALAKLLPMQRSDFESIFRAMEGYPVTIRLLDPPLHEFLPANGTRSRDGQGDGQGSESAADRRRHAGQPDARPRGCRLGITIPEISAMQAAISRPPAPWRGRAGQPEVMIPLVATWWSSEAGADHPAGGRGSVPEKQITVPTCWAP
jgi:pyruvate,orthophosphate dikinase